MKIRDGICYADSREQPLTIVGFKVNDDWTIRLKFSNGEVRTVDMHPLLSCKAFKPLEDIEKFKDVSLEYGTLSWLDGEIDIAPEYLWEQSGMQPSVQA